MRKHWVSRSCGWVVAATVASACAAEPTPSGLPTELPFTFERPGADQTLPPAETAAFTRKLGAFFKSTDHFAWILRTSHGVHVSTGKPDFSLWWDGVELVKTGDTVTFRHRPDGGGHNVYIPTSKALAGAIGAYLWTRDASAGRLVEQYAKGIAAACRGLVHDALDPNPYLMARNVVAQNHAYTLEEGRKAAVDFSGWYSAYEQWNAQRFEYASNPFWGDVWVTNMRSKDDVPHIYFADLWLRYVLERGEDARVLEAARLGDDCVKGFARDVVDSGYLIRTKDREGKVFVPEEDLASFIQFDALLPNGECSGKLSSAYVGHGDARGNACGENASTDYENIAVGTHYYNYAITRTFHLASLLGALEAKDVEAARRLLRGLQLRLERYLDPASGEPGQENPGWSADTAVQGLMAATLGLPLLPAEARLIVEQFGLAMDEAAKFDGWDLWSKPDGVFADYRPNLAHGVNLEELSFVFLYCASPFRSTSGAIPVDCAALKDPGQWGQLP